MSMSRRMFLGSVAGGATLVTTSWLGAGCGNNVDPAPIIDTSVDDDPASPSYGQVTVIVPMYPDLAAVGGAVTLRLAPLPAGNRPFIVPEGGIIVVHRAPAGDPPEFVSLTARCPHEGCPLGYSRRDQLVECPCHASRFLVVPDPDRPGSVAGQVIHLPAKSNLTSWKTELDADGFTLRVDLKTIAGQALPPITNGQIVVPVADFPSLASPGGWFVGQAQGLGDVLMLVRRDASSFAVLSAICTHLGCTLTYSPNGGGELACPCHASFFTLTGQATQGPATTNLRLYSSTFDGQTLVITI